MPNIRLEPVTVHNWLDCIHLSLLDSQKDIVPSNLYSIAEAQFYPEARPLAVHNEANQMVGFVRDRNHIARILYVKLGFVAQSIDDKGRITALYMANTGKS